MALPQQRIKRSKGPDDPSKRREALTAERPRIPTPDPSDEKFYPTVPATRDLIEQLFRYRIRELSKPSPIPAPRRTWSELEMATIRRGYVAQVMEEHWNGFVENNRILILRSWTGYLIYEAHVARVPEEWKIVSASVESDLNFYVRGTDSFECVSLERLISGMLLGEDDATLEERFDRELAKNVLGARIIITKAKGPVMPITRPGHSVKHGKLVDQHPLQREAYDKAFAQGHKAATKAIRAGGKTPADVYYSAHRHEERAFQTIGIESSRHAGLAKGAKVAAYEYYTSHPFT